MLKMLMLTRKDKKKKDLQQALDHIQILETDISNKDKEITQSKTHISELNLHAEAQAKEYKQKFKALEAMVEQVKPEGYFTNAQSHSGNKLEKNVAKPRGSGSPFKCIGLGLAQQIKSEKDEDLTAARLRIEELESLAANRQKEVDFTTWMLILQLSYRLWSWDLLVTSFKHVLFHRYLLSMQD